MNHTLGIGVRLASAVIAAFFFLAFLSACQGNAPAPGVNAAAVTNAAGTAGTTTSDSGVQTPATGGQAAAIPEKYAELAAALKQQIASIDQFVNALNASNSAAEVAKAIDAYAIQSRDQAREFEYIKARVPGAETETTPPPEMTPILAEMQAASNRFQGTMLIIEKYLGDPAVEAANKRLQEAILGF